MKKIKGLFLCLTVLFALTMLTACGKVPEPTKKDVLKGLEKEGYISESRVDNDEYTVEMKEIEIDDDKEGSTVECIVSYEEDIVRVNTEYKIKFKIKDDKESWKVKKITQNETTYELVQSISEDSLEEVLYWDSIEVDGSYIYFYNDSTTFTVTDSELQGSEMINVVTVEVNAVTGYKNVTATIKYTLYYDYYSYGSYGYWEIQEKEILDVETSYVEGYEITLTEDRVVEDIINERDYVYLLGQYYYLDEGDVTITNVRIGENTYNDSYMTVPVTITVTHEKCSFDVNYDLQYYFDSYDYEWEIYRLTVLDTENFNGDIVGVWTGTSDDGYVTLTITKDFHVEYTSSLDVVVEVTTSTGEVYSYSAFVYCYYPESGYVDIYGYEWIVEPTGSYNGVGFEGYCEDGEFNSCDYWYDFTLTKSGE